LGHSLYHVTSPNHPSQYKVVWPVTKVAQTDISTFVENFKHLQHILPSKSSTQYFLHSC
jgi:hypothetical protein